MDNHVQPDLRLDEATHTYAHKGRVVPSVTQVLSSVGVRSNGYWHPVGFDAQFGDDNAAEFGTAFHKFAAAKLAFRGVVYPAEMEPYVAQFDEFVNDRILTPLTDEYGNALIEYPLYHDVYGYCGTPDVIGTTSDRKGVCIVDWKTSTTKGDHWPLQLAAYAELVKHALGIKVSYCVAVMVGADKYKVIRYDTPAADWPRFQSCLNIFKMIKE